MQRIFTYSSGPERLFLGFATIASILTGVMLPLMNVVFGTPPHYLHIGDADEFVKVNSLEHSRISMTLTLGNRRKRLLVSLTKMCKHSHHIRSLQEYEQKA